jgi:hypothetical protein
MPAPKIDVELGAKIAEFKTAMDQAGAAFHKLTELIAGETPRAAKQAEGAIESLSARLREHRSEHVQTARAVGAFTRELEGIVGKGNAAAGAIAALAGGLAIGGGFGFAIEGAKLLFEHLTRVSEEEKKAKENLEEWFKTLAEGHGTAVAQIKTLWNELRGLTLAGQLGEAATENEKDIDRVTAALETARQKWSDLGGGTMGEKILGLFERKDVRQAREEVESLTKQLEALKQKRQDLNETQTAVVAVDTKKADETAAEEARKAREKMAAEDKRAGDAARAGFERQLAESAALRLKWAEKGADDETKVRLQLAADLAKVDKLDQDTRIFLEAQAAAQIKAIRDKLAADAEATERATIEKATAELQARLEKAARPWINFGNTIANAFGRGFTQALFHAQSFEDGIKAVFDGILAAFEKLIEEMVAKLMASAILGFLGSIIGGPLGAFLGKQAGGLFFGLGGGGAPGMSSFFGDMAPSADIGLPRVPQNMLLNVHKDEAVLTPSQAEAWRGGGGGNITVHIHALDGASVYRVLKDNESAFGRFFREGAAGGRFG